MAEAPEKHTMKTVTMKEWVDLEYNALISNAELFLGKT